MKVKTKFIVITSINESNKTIEVFSKWKDWQLVVVGDRKTPKNWRCKNVVFLDIDEQYKMFGKLARAIPENTYVRKIFGYIYAIQHGATVIFETDDDNIPYKNAQKIVEFFPTKLDWSQSVRSKNGWVNIYEKFGVKNCWPRGFPINLIKDKASKGLKGRDIKPFGVIQFLVDQDPDVDAIYRMVGSQKPIEFKKRGLYSLDEGTYCPFNSQATLWFPDSFPLMFLPLGVPDRVTDILRGFIALACLWKLGKTVSFYDPILFQERNPHNLLNDFKQEFMLYKHSDEWSKLLLEVKGTTPSELYLSAIKLLVKNGFLPDKNLKVYLQYLKNINA